MFLDGSVSLGYLKPPKASHKNLTTTAWSYFDKKDFLSQYCTSYKNIQVGKGDN